MDLGFRRARLQMLSSSPLQMKANTAAKREFPAGQPYKHYLRYGAVAQLRERYPMLGEVPGTNDSGSIHGSIPGYKGLCRATDWLTD